MQIDFTLFDFKVVLDLSASMASKYSYKDVNGHTILTEKSRLSAVKEFTQGLVEALEAYDDDGISVGYFGANRSEIYENVGTSRIYSLLEEFRPFGNTPLDLALDTLFNKSANAKPQVVFVITDGAPTDVQSSKNLLLFAGKNEKNRDNLFIQFIQIGEDLEASQFLDFINNELRQKSSFKFASTRKFETISGVEDAIRGAINV